MAKADYSSVRILISVDNQIVRKGIFDALRTNGYTQITLATSREDQHAALQNQIFDLIILTSHLGPWSTDSLITDIRNGRSNHHRFPIVIMLLVDGLPDTVRAAVASGADAVLVMPVAPSLVLARVNDLANARKPFVVTRDYTGPDRRKEERKGSMPAPKMDTPNPMRARLDQVPDAVFEKDVRRASQQLNTIKVERYGAQINWVIEAISKMFHAGESNPKALATYGAALEQMAEALPDVLGTAMTTRLKQLLQAVVLAAKTILRDDVKLSIVEFELVSKACKELLRELTVADAER